MTKAPYSTKTRATRIELDYFKRLHPFRQLKFILSIAAPLVAAGWLVTHVVRGDQRIYSSGPVSVAHAMFGTQCADCHGPGLSAGGPPRSPFFMRVKDPACLACHDAPIHHESQAFEPSCASCHVEHKGHVTLTAVGDALCSQCHADLTRTSRKAPLFAAQIRDFGFSHPEFAVAVKAQGVVRRIRLDSGADVKDLAQIKLNHQKHLKIGLKGLAEVQTLRGASASGILVRPGGLQLSCAFCHAYDATRASMQPISYVKHCGPGCHPLDIDARLPDVVAPHDTPEIVHAFLRTLFIEAFERCQPSERRTPDGDAADKLTRQCRDLDFRMDAEPGARGGRRQTDSPEEAPSDRPRGGRRGVAVEEQAPTPPAPSSSSVGWASAQLEGAERVMFKQKCEFCHTLRYTPHELPRVVGTMIPPRWLPHSVFNHGAHRLLACGECHKASVSTDTVDVLLPSITVCRECHRESAGARSACVECHRYHDRAKERDSDGPFTISQVKRPPTATRP